MIMEKLEDKEFMKISVNHDKATKKEKGEYYVELGKVFQENEIYDPKVKTRRMFEGYRMTEKGRFGKIIGHLSLDPNFLSPNFIEFVEYTQSPTSKPNILQAQINDDSEIVNARFANIEMNKTLTNKTKVEVKYNGVSGVDKKSVSNFLELCGRNFDIKKLNYIQESVYWDQTSALNKFMAFGNVIESLNPDSESDAFIELT